MTDVAHPVLPSRPPFWRAALAFTSILGVLGLMFLATTLIDLPFVDDAKTQLKTAYPGQNVVLHEFHVRGSECGYYTSSGSQGLRLFLVDQAGVVTAPGPAPVASNLSDGSEALVRWSSCMYWGRFRHSAHDNAAAVWLINRFER